MNTQYAPTTDYPAPTTVVTVPTTDYNELPATGTDSTLMVGVALILVAVGLILVRLAYNWFNISDRSKR